MPSPGRQRMMRSPRMSVKISAPSSGCQTGPSVNTSPCATRSSTLCGGTIRQAWGAVDPFKGEEAILQAEQAVKGLHLLGFHFHPIMGRFSVDDQRLYALWESIDALKVPGMG